MSIDAKRAFARVGENIRLPFTEVLLCSAVIYLTQSKKLQDWTILNAVLLLTFLNEVVVLVIQTSAEELINIFATNISERESEAASNKSDSEGGDDLGEDGETTSNT